MVAVLPFVIFGIVACAIIYIGIGTNGFIRAILGKFYEDQKANNIADFLRGLLFGIFIQTIFPIYILFIFFRIIDIGFDKIFKIFEKTKSKPDDTGEKFETDFEGTGILIGSVIAAPVWFVLFFFDGYIAELMGK